jgi:hypothetical protein
VTVNRGVVSVEEQIIPEIARASHPHHPRPKTGSLLPLFRIKSASKSHQKPEACFRFPLIKPELHFRLSSP